MSNIENELKDLKEKNNELVQKVQYWKMTAGQRETEKLELMKEINELRLKLSRLRSGGAAHARKLDAALQSASEEALSHLVQASSAVARTIELAKTYMQDRQELETSLPRWSSIGNTPSMEKVHRVPPMLIGGQSIQPVVSLSRTLLNSSSSSSTSQSPNQGRNVTQRPMPMPMHMLQDVYIPLTRIDAREVAALNGDVSEHNEADDSADELGLEDSGERVLDESQNVSDNEETEESRRLDAVIEDLEPDEEETPPRRRSENPLEGPSWLLDLPNPEVRRSKNRTTLEADSTTEVEESERPPPSPPLPRTHIDTQLSRAAAAMSVRVSFSPTVRRRKRTASPAPLAPLAPHTPHAPTPASPGPSTPRYSPRPLPKKNSVNNRILKVMVAKMRLDEDEGGRGDPSPPKIKREAHPEGPTATTQKVPRGVVTSPVGVVASPAMSKKAPHGAVLSPLGAPLGSPLGSPVSRDMSPAKRLMRFDAPSPNGATDAHVIVSESTVDHPQSCSSVDHRRVSRDERRGPSHDAHDADDSRATTQSRDSRTTIQSLESRDSDSGSDRACEGRTRRPRKAITYKEKPLNRKLRR